MFVGAGLAVLLMNLLFRFGAKGDDERQAEDDAREYFVQPRPLAGREALGISRGGRRGLSGNGTRRQTVSSTLVLGAASRARPEPGSQRPFLPPAGGTVTAGRRWGVGGAGVGAPCGLPLRGVAVRNPVFEAAHRLASALREIR